MKQAIGFYPCRDVDGAGTQVVSQAGAVLLTETVRAVGLDRALSTALARWRPPAGTTHCSAPQTSVLADYCGRSEYANQAQRVVAGQHLMQAQSDIFLGWTRVVGPDGVERDFYVRQLRDWKFSVPIEQMLPAGMMVYAGLCGWTLVRAHACSGDCIALACYLGNSSKFDQAIAGFAETYADQNERDYAALQAAVKEGRAESTTEI